MFNWFHLFPILKVFVFGYYSDNVFMKITWLVYIWKYHVDFTLNDNLVGEGAELLGHIVFRS